MGTSIMQLEPLTRFSLRLAIEASIREGIQFFITSTVRSFFEQLQLFLKFKAGQSKFPAAPPGKSTHQRGIAVDLVPKRQGTLPDVVDLMRRHGFKWAGPRDRVHFTHQGRSPAAMERPARERKIERVRRRRAPEQPAGPPAGAPAGKPSLTLPICHS